MINLEEARKQGKIDQFIKEHPSESDERFGKLLDVMTTGSPEVEETSAQDASEDCSGIQARQGTSQDGGD